MGELTARRLVITFVPVLELHFRDTCNTVSPETLPDGLRAAGFHDIDVECVTAGNAGVPLRHRT
jgi:hypothetical protein